MSGPTTKSYAAMSSEQEITDASKLDPDAGIPKPTFGAFLENINLAKEPVGRLEIETVRQALMAHRILAFPMQRFDESEGGPVHRLVDTAKKLFNNELEEVGDDKFVQLYVSEGGRTDTLNSDLFHSDLSYKSTPASVTMLWALEVPRGPGDSTVFVNMAAIAQAFPPMLRLKLEGKTARHELDGWAVRGGSPSKGVAADHPVLRNHPVTGEEILFVSPSYTTSIEGDTDGTLMRQLFDMIEDKRFHMTFNYQAGDLVMWDNASVLHKATTMDLPEGKSRVMMRISVLGRGDGKFNPLSTEHL